MQVIKCLQEIGLSRDMAYLVEDFLGSRFLISKHLIQISAPNGILTNPMIEPLAICSADQVVQGSFAHRHKKDRFCISVNGFEDRALQLDLCRPIWNYLTAEATIWFQCTMHVDSRLLKSIWPPWPRRSDNDKDLSLDGIVLWGSTTADLMVLEGNARFCRWMIESSSPMDSVSVFVGICPEEHMNSTMGWQRSDGSKQVYNWFPEAKLKWRRKFELLKDPNADFDEHGNPIASWPAVE